jgi:uncharacterized repeat protein (TIGR01451 family)
VFKKLVSNLPFQPAALSQVSFYLRRLHQEESLRKIGFFLMIFVLIIQVFAIVSPSQPSLATSANDIIYGARSKDQVMQAYINNKDTLGRKDIRAIYDHYGIGTKQISAAKYQRIGSRQKNFVSTGRSTAPGSNNFISIPGVANGGIYERLLKNWDRGYQQSWYDTISGISRFGFRFWIIIDGCGNIVFEQNSLPSNLEIRKTLNSAKTVKPGDSVQYLIQFRNTGPGVAKNVTIKDTLPNDLIYKNYKSNINLKLAKSGQNLTWTLKNNQLGPSQKWQVITLTLEVSDKEISNNLICNSATISAKGVKDVSVNNSKDKRCINIIQPSLKCQNLKIVSSPTWNERQFEATIDAHNLESASRVNFFVDNILISSSPVNNGSTAVPFNYVFPKEGSYTIRADLESTDGVGLSGRDCEIHETIEQPINPEARISTDKTVSNLTQNIQDANGTTANPGDQLKYTLYIDNHGDASVNNLELSGEYGESINDILEYSNLIDKEDAQFDEQNKFLSWSSVDIPAGGQIQKSFIVQIKDPLPATPASASDPLSYDFNMQNIYGRSVVIHLDRPPTKVIEQTVQVLPNTGPGSSLTLCVIAVTIIGYFFYRNRLIVKELEIVKDEYASGGI